MPRIKPRKSTKGMFSEETMKAALNDVLAGKTIRRAAKEHNLSFSTLYRKYKKLNGATEIPEDLRLTSNYCHQLVFEPHLENELAAYIKERSELGHGLDSDEVRLLAYDYAVANQIKVPEPWTEKKTAGKEWFISFMKRHQELSLRTPQGFSTSRAACFNKPNIQSYFEKLKNVLDRNPKFASGERVWNGDEVGTTTVGAITRKVVGAKGARQVHQTKSHERGESVTSFCFISAQGTFMPPVMLFPRITFNSGMLKDCYPGTKAIPTGRKGYMNNQVMVDSIKHFIKHSHSSKDDPSVLILDNFGSHITLDVINICKDNGVILFTLPPHTTHRTQPLDVGMFSPFKRVYDRAVHTWSSSHPGESVSIYEVAGFVNTALVQSFTPKNIQSAFRATGIIPFNPDIFPDKDYFKSTVTFQEDPANTQDEPLNVQDNEEMVDDPVPPTPSTLASSSNISSVHVSPSEVLPLPKAVPKKSSKKPRKKGKCMIATDTPEKLAIEAAENEKKRLIEEKEKRKILREQKKKEAEKRKKSPSVVSTRAKKTKRALFEEVDSSSEDGQLSISSRSSVWHEEEEEEPLQPDSFPPLDRSPEEGEYVLVEFAGKEVAYYVGKIISEEDKDGEFEISYLRKSEKSLGKFVYPNVKDFANVDKKDIKIILPKPTTSGTRRQQNLLGFDFDFSLLKVL